jgi:chorismate-pyruvate lyase
MRVLALCLAFCLCRAAGPPPGAVTLPAAVPEPLHATYVALTTLEKLAVHSSGSLQDKLALAAEAAVRVELVASAAGAGADGGGWTREVALVVGNTTCVVARSHVRRLDSAAEAAELASGAVGIGQLLKRRHPAKPTSDLLGLELAPDGSLKSRTYLLKADGFEAEIEEAFVVRVDDWAGVAAADGAAPGSIIAGSRTAAVPSRAADVARGTGGKAWRRVRDAWRYRGYRHVFRRTVELPSGAAADFDVVSQGGDDAVLVLAWDPASETATLVREYHPGTHEVRVGVVGGLLEHRRHADAADAARAELAEEARLAGGDLVPLTAPGGAPVDKYSDAVFHCFVAVGATPIAAEDVPERDAEEEGLEVVTGVSRDELLRMAESGELNVSSAWAALLAVRWIDGQAGSGGGSEE